MGRFLMYTALCSLALFVVATYSVVEHGGGTISAVRELSLHDLTSAAPAYEDSTVTTFGYLNFNEELDHYELIDDNANFAVPIRDYDEAKLLLMVGKWVAVVGKVGANDELGTYIQASNVHLSDEPTPEPE